MNMKRVLSCVAVLALVATVGCSKNKKADEGAASADNVGMQATELAPAAGAPIPELQAVYFDYDSFAINASSRAALEGHAGWLKANGGKSVQIEGHCDERGTTEYNLALGERRATSVRDFLIGKGVPANQLSTISYGEERAAMQGGSEAAWSKNRRAEFVSGGAR
jgi:peptidoglycan-associated lipoprotein